MDNSPYGIMSLWLHGGWIIRLIAIILFSMSIISWTLIIKHTLRHMRLQKLANLTVKNNTKTVSSQEISNSQNVNLNNPFISLEQCAKLSAQQYLSSQTLVKKRIAMDQWLTENLRGNIDSSSAELHKGLPILASIGATAPFIGLFGTVWGIYHALVFIGTSGQVAIDKIAGPVGESLIMTALGLAVAIPAVLGYNALNRLNANIIEILNQLARQHYIYLLSEFQIETSDNKDA